MGIKRAKVETSSDDRINTSDAGEHQRMRLTVRDSRGRLLEEYSIEEAEWRRFCRESCGDVEDSAPQTREDSRCQPRRCEDGWIDGPPPENSGLCACEFRDGRISLVRGATLCRGDIVRHFRIPPPPSPPAPEPPKAVRVRFKNAHQVEGWAIPSNGKYDYVVASGNEVLADSGLYYATSLEVLPAAESGQCQ